MGVFSDGQIEVLPTLLWARQWLLEQGSWPTGSGFLGLGFPELPFLFHQGVQLIDYPFQMAAFSGNFPKVAMGDMGTEFLETIEVLETKPTFLHLGLGHSRHWDLENFDHLQK